MGTLATVLLLTASCLGSPRFQTRQRAEALLTATWPLSAAAVAWGQESDDPEIVWRASRVERRFAIPGPPPEPPD